MKVVASLSFRLIEPRPNRSRREDSLGCLGIFESFTQPGRHSFAQTRRPPARLIMHDDRPRSPEFRITVRIALLSLCAIEWEGTNDYHSNIFDIAQGSLDGRSKKGSLLSLQSRKCSAMEHGSNRGEGFQ